MQKVGIYQSQSGLNFLSSRSALLMQFELLEQKMVPYADLRKGLAGEYGQGNRFLYYTPPEHFDVFGCHKQHGLWQHHICVIDDFGDAVPVSGFYYGWQAETA